MQGSYFEFRSHFAATSNVYVYDLTALNNDLNNLAAAVLPVYISEFDIHEAIDPIQLAQCKLSQDYPNPFNLSATTDFALSKGATSVIRL